MALPTLSASKLKLFKLCAQKYKLTYVEPMAQEVSTQNIASLVGTAIHKAIEMWYKNGANPRTTYRDTFYNTLAEWESKQANVIGKVSQSFVEGQKMIEGIKFEDMIPTDLELRFSLPFPNKENPICVINGVIDMVTADECVIDHKSKNVKEPNLNELANDVQFLLYAWAYKELTGKFPRAVYWHHLRNGKLYEVDVMSDYDKKIARMTEDLEAMLTATRFQRKELDRFCTDYCEFFSHCFTKAQVV
jgi:hypothetical protein